MELQDADELYQGVLAPLLAAGVANEGEASRTALAGSLGRVFAHAKRNFWENNLETVAACKRLLRDPSFSVRLALGDSIASLPSSEVIEIMFPHSSQSQQNQGQPTKSAPVHSVNARVYAVSQLIASITEEMVPPFSFAFSLILVSYLKKCNQL